MTESKESLDKLALPQEYKMLAATAPTMFYHRNIEMLTATLPTKKREQNTQSTDLQHIITA